MLPASGSADKPRPAGESEALLIKEERERGRKVVNEESRVRDIICTGLFGKKCVCSLGIQRNNTLMESQRLTPYTPL